MNLAARIKAKDPQTLAILMLVAVGIGYAIYWLVTAATWIPFPYQIDYGEGYNLYFAKLWANGGWNWDITQEPYFTLMYGPIYFLIIAPLSNVFGLSFEVGRTVMAAATGISCVFLGLIAYHISRRKLLGVLAGLLPLTQPIVRDWGMQSRVDPLAVMFSIIGIWFAIKFQNSKWFWMAPVFLVLAFYTKVSVIGIIAVAVFLVISRNWKRLAGFGGVTAALIFVPMLAYPPLFTHMIIYNVMPLWDFAIQVLMPIAIFIVPITGILIVALYYIKKNKASLPAVWAIVAVVVSTVLILRKGSSSNYYFEAVFAVALVGTLGIPGFVSFIKTHIELKWAGALVAGIILLPIVTTINPHVFPLPSEEYKVAVEQTIYIIGDTNEPIPTENAGIVVMAGKDLLIEPMLFTNMANNGKWNQSKYVSDLQEQRFDYLVLRNTLEEHVKDPSGHFTAEASGAAIENYSLVYEYEDVNAWWYIIRVYEANGRLA